MISGSEKNFDSFYCGMGDIDREELRSPRSESRRRSQSPRSRTRSRSHQRSTAEDQCNDTNPEIEAEQRKHEVSNPYPDGLSDIEIDIPSFPPKVQRPKPDRTPPKNPRTPKPGSGSGSVLQTLAGSYRVITFTTTLQGTEGTRGSVKFVMAPKKFFYRDTKILLNHGFPRPILPTKHPSLPTICFVSKNGNPL